MNKESQQETPSTSYAGGSGIFASFRDSLLNIIEKYGADSVVGFVSPCVSNEAAYLFQKFMRTCVGNNNIIGTQGPEIALDPLRSVFESLGTLTVTPPLENLNNADCILIINGGPLPDQTEVMDAVEQARRDYGSEVIILGPENSRLSEIATYQFHVPPEGETEVLRSFLRVVNLYGGLDREVIWRDSDGYKTIAQKLRFYSPESIAERWNIDAENLLKAGLLISQKRSLSILVCSHGFPDFSLYRSCQDAINLILASGNIGSKGRGFHYVPRYQNTLGIMLMGCSPGFLPGFAAIQEESATDWFSTCWSKRVLPMPGYSFEETMQRLEEDQVKCVIYLGGSPVDYLPESQALVSRLARVEMIAGAGFQLDPRCHYWWPLKPLARTDGTYVSPDKRLRLIESGDLDPLLYQDWELMGQWFHYVTGEEVSLSHRKVFKEMTETIPFLIGVNPERLRNEDIVFQTFIDESNNLTETDLNIRDLPRIQFSSIPEPSDAPLLSQLHLIVRNLDAFPDSESISDELRKHTALLTGIHPNDASRMKIPDRVFITIHTNTLQLTGYSIIYKGVPEGSIEIWVRDNREVGLLTSDSGEFLKVTLSLAEG